MMSSLSAKCTLLLLGHGSHFHPDSSRPIFYHAHRLKQADQWCDVRVGLWKEEPSLARCLDACTTETVVAVPVFMSVGYFTEEIVPRELRLSGASSQVDGRWVYYVAPVGTDPRLADVIAERAKQVGATANSSVIVLGHGTSCNPNSQTTIYEQAARVRAKQSFAEVETVFLDQVPKLDHVWSLTSTQHLVVVPLFVADGWHVGATIPEDLGLTHGGASRDGRRLDFTAAVGTHPQLTDVIHELGRSIL